MISAGCHLFKAPLPLEGLAFRGVEPGCSGEVGSSPQEPALRILWWALLGLAAGAQPGATSWLDTELVFPPSPGAWGEGAGAGRSESLPSQSAQCRGGVEDDKQGPRSLEFLRDLRARSAFGDDWVLPSLFIDEEPGACRGGSLV